MVDNVYDLVVCMEVIGDDSGIVDWFDEGYLGL